MNKVAVMTDSVTYMPEDVAQKYDILRAQAHVIINGKSVRENEVDLPEFYQQIPKWKKEDKLPTTSSPATDDFLKAFRDLSQKAEAIVYVGYSAKLGMAVSAAQQAKALLAEELAQTPIEVIDCQSACGAQMLVVLEATKAAAEGKNLDEVVKAARDITNKVTFITLMDDLYYLAKGGRIHRARPWSASKISNSVLLEMNAKTGGEMSPLARCRTKGEALKTLFNLVAERSQGRKLHVAINHADSPLEAAELKEKVMAQFPCQDVFVTNIGPLVTTHTGLGTRIFSFWAEE